MRRPRKILQSGTEITQPDCCVDVNTAESCSSLQRQHTPVLKALKAPGKTGNRENKSSSTSTTFSSSSSTIKKSRRSNGNRASDLLANVYPQFLNRPKIGTADLALFPECAEVQLMLKLPYLMFHTGRRPDLALDEVLRHERAAADVPLPRKILLIDLHPSIGDGPTQALTRDTDLGGGLSASVRTFGEL